ncbi:hypothetical protein BDZ94DRAFT_639126 [Collybia nuda]|uniref:Uncharacterized protein n=1 Tax=Collybia nuda TaxID=64659 RepID=A0A9P6CJR9_9AGAR|nr:hypothetical protein BDZ94DRAFT_639126 [Collybia nuda]
MLVNSKMWWPTVILIMESQKNFELSDCTMLLLKIPLLKSNNATGRARPTSDAKCLDDFIWMQNSAGMSPCLVSSGVFAACAGPAWNIPSLNNTVHYTSPNGTTANDCSCSWSAYNLLGACTACQGFPEFILGGVSRGVYPSIIIRLVFPSANPIQYSHPILGGHGSIFMAQRKVRRHNGATSIQSRPRRYCSWSVSAPHSHTGISIHRGYFHLWCCYGYTGGDSSGGRYLALFTLSQSPAPDRTLSSIVNFGSCIIGAALYSISLHFPKTTPL